MQAMVKHTQDKDQFLKLVIKRMQETQAFEDRLKEVSELNSVLFAQNQELEAKLVEESHVKVGKPPWSFVSIIGSCPSNTRLIATLFCRVQGSTHGPRHHSY
jgi:hypothetical protein